MLGGGFPMGHVVLVTGLPGTGKTCFGLQFLLATSRLRQKKEDLDSAEPGVVGAALPSCLSGGAEVDGQAKELADKAASLLAKQTLLPMGPFKILEKTDSRIRFEVCLPGIGNQAASRWLRRGE